MLNFLPCAGILGNHQKNHGDQPLADTVSPTPATVDPSIVWTTEPTTTIINQSTTTTTNPTEYPHTTATTQYISHSPTKTNNNEKSKSFHNKSESTVDNAEGGGDQEIYVDDSLYPTTRRVEVPSSKQRRRRSVGGRGASIPVLIENKFNDRSNQTIRGNRQRNVTDVGVRKRLIGDDDDDDDVGDDDDAPAALPTIHRTSTSAVSNEDELGDEPKVLALRPIIGGQVVVNDDDSSRPAIVYAEPHAEIKLSCDVDLDIMSTVWMKDGRVSLFFVLQVFSAKKSTLSLS